MQKDLKLQKSFEPSFVPKFKITLHNLAAQRKATNGGYVGNLPKGRLCTVQLNWIVVNVGGIKGKHTVLWVENLAAHPKGRIRSEGLWE